MAAKKPTANVVEVDGIQVEINSDYLKSWDGVMKAVEMQRLAEDENATEADKLMALLEYYSNAIANIDAIKDALGGGNVPVDAVFSVASKALSESSEKN